jgi:hypothetical protein
MEEAGIEKFKIFIDGYNDGSFSYSGVGVQGRGSRPSG